MDLADYSRTPAVLRRGAAELSLPVVHVESLDSATVSWCRDWRAEIRMTDLASIRRGSHGWPLPQAGGGAGFAHPREVLRSLPPSTQSIICSMCIRSTLSPTPSGA